MNIINEDTKPAMQYILYECAPSIDARGQTKQKRIPPCGHINILRSRFTPKKGSGHQRQCSACGKWQRISAGQVVEIYENRWKAISRQEALNGQR